MISLSEMRFMTISPDAPKIAIDQAVLEFIQHSGRSDLITIKNRVIYRSPDDTEGHVALAAAKQSVHRLIAKRKVTPMPFRQNNRVQYRAI